MNIRPIGTGSITQSFVIIISLSMFNNWKKYSHHSVTFKEYTLSVCTTHNGRGGQGRLNSMLVTHDHSGVVVAQITPKYQDGLELFMAMGSNRFDIHDFFKGSEDTEIEVEVNVTVDLGTGKEDIFVYASQEEKEQVALMDEISAINSIKSILLNPDMLGMLGGPRTPSGLFPIVTDGPGDTDGDLPAFLQAMSRRKPFQA